MDWHTVQAFPLMSGILFSSTYRLSTTLAFILHFSMLTPSFQATFKFISRGKQPKVQPEQAL